MSELEGLELRRRLVEAMRRRGVLRSRRIEQAFAAIPRERFLPGLPLAEVYADRSVVIKTSGDEVLSTSSQPSMMAIMLEQLAVREGDNVLEVGTGSGYNAALLATLAGAQGAVTSLDIDSELIQAARARLSEYDGNVTLRTADAERLDEPSETFDRIVVAVAASEVSPDWFRVLREGGRLVVPLELGALQLCIAFERKGAVLASISCAGTAFIPLRGAARHAASSSRLREAPFFVRSAAPDAPGANELWRLLCMGQTGEWPAAVGLGQLDDAAHWLDVNRPGLCVLYAHGSALEAGVVPSVTGSAEEARDSVMTFGYGSRESLGVFGLGPSGDVRVRSYGSPDAAGRLHAGLEAWNAAGRPALARLRVEVAFAEPEVVLPGDLQLQRPRSTLLVRWT